MGFQEYIDAANDWVADFQEKAVAYFQGCTEYEWLAWGGEALGLILVVVGIILL